MSGLWQEVLNKQERNTSVSNHQTLQNRQDYTATKETYATSVKRVSKVLIPVVLQTSLSNGIDIHGSGLDKNLLTKSAKKRYIKTQTFSDRETHAKRPSGYLNANIVPEF